MRRPYSVQVFLYREKPTEKTGGDREFLLFKRVARSDLGLPEFWQGISGALEIGESFEAAALREVFEESAFRIAKALPSGFIHSYPIRPEWRKHYGPDALQVEERIYFAKVAIDARPILSAEHSEFCWCTWEDALNRLNFGRNRDALTSIGGLLEA